MIKQGAPQVGQLALKLPFLILQASVPSLVYVLKRSRDLFDE